MNPAAILLLQSKPCRPVLRLLVETLAPWADASASISLGREDQPIYSEPGNVYDPGEPLLGITRADVHRLARMHDALRLILKTGEKGAASATQTEAANAAG